MDVASECEQWQEGHSAGWSETHRLDVFAPQSSERSATLGITLSISRQPGTGSARFRAAVLETGTAPIGLVEDDVAAPSRGWEIRASGLWADHVCERPLEHWTYGLEAFALEIDEERALLGDERGRRVPLGWELDFEADEAAEWSGSALGEQRSCYHQRGAVHGILLSEDGERAIEGRGLRRHWWGEPDGEPDGAGFIVAPAVVPRGGLEPSSPSGDLGRAELWLPRHHGVERLRLEASGLTWESMR